MKRRFLVLLAVPVLAVVSAPVLAQVPRLTFVEEAKTPGQVSTTLQLLAIFTILSLVPSIVLMTTCFTRIVVVLSFVRRALSTQELPPNQVMIGLALFLSFMIMAPVFDRIKDEALLPYLDNQLPPREALAKALTPLRGFMLDHTRRKDVKMFLEMSRTPMPADGRLLIRDDIPTMVLIPAFMTSELRRSFMMGFVIYLPFVIIDLVVASTLISMGMLVLPPVMVSLPLKILLFVLVDGWGLICGSLVKSFAAGP